MATNDWVISVMKDQKELIQNGGFRHHQMKDFIRPVIDIMKNEMNIFVKDDKKIKLVTMGLNNLGFNDSNVVKEFSKIFKYFNVEGHISPIDLSEAPEEYFKPYTNYILSCNNPVPLLFFGNKPGDLLFIYIFGDHAKEAVHEVNNFFIRLIPNEWIKVIFLDIDGVLNSINDEYDYDLETDMHLELLNKIVTETDSKIVLSSSWRRIRSLIVDCLLPRLNEYNLDILDYTPYIPEASCRGEEIASWLRNTTYGVTNFAILDDNNDMSDFTPTNLIQTNECIGLQEEDANKCIELLNK